MDSTTYGFPTPPVVKVGLVAEKGLLKHGPKINMKKTAKTAG
jgi:hypothetical protein